VHALAAIRACEETAAIVDCRERRVGRQLPSPLTSTHAPKFQQIDPAFDAIQTVYGWAIGWVDVSIRLQLLIVALTTLVLPWAGCQYARELDTALRDSQEKSPASRGHIAMPCRLAENACFRCRRALERSPLGTRDFPASRAAQSRVRAQY